MANSVTRQLLLAEIERRGWSAQEIGAQAYFLKIIHPDGRWEMVRGSCPRRSSAIGLLLCKRKDLMLDFVRSYGYQVPEYELVQDVAQAEAFLRQHTMIVVKPVDGARTEGVSVGITDNASLQPAYHMALEASDSNQVIVQKHITGNLYRILVLDGKLVAAAWRSAAQVIGDGQRTVAELVTQLNNDPRRGKGVDSPLKTIDVGSVTDYLGASKMQFVPEVNEQVALSAIDSVSAGGEAVTVTQQVHPKWRSICEQMAIESGLFIAGYDTICEDITQPPINNYFPLLEINAEPGFKLHEYPTGGGEPDHIAPLLLDALFPAL